MAHCLRPAFASLITALLLIFALQNLNATDVRLLFWSAKLPLVVVILVSVASGALLAALWLTMKRRKKAE